MRTAILEGMREQFARGERDAASGRNAAHGEGGRASRSLVTQRSDDEIPVALSGVFVFSCFRVFIHRVVAALRDAHVCTSPAHPTHHRGRSGERLRRWSMAEAIVDETAQAERSTVTGRPDGQACHASFLLWLTTPVPITDPPRRF